MVDESSDNVEKQIDDPEEVPGLTDEDFFECPNPDCPGDDEEFTLFIQHEIKRHQDQDNSEVDATWQGAEVEAIVCDGCRKIVYISEGPYSDGEDAQGEPEQEESKPDEGDDDESQYA